ncbi:MAG: UbiA prenyltransferase family protein [Chitinophagaceae bacterium]|nr:UbiA prenyltransferase family protein [Chitinophagaceae bacterium]
MPVYWFALSQTVNINIAHAIIIFIILHLLVYPASNGYNSYMDKDTGSIGGIEVPQQPTRQLLYASIYLDITALLASYFISIYFFTGIFLYILVSRAYSYRGIRLKKYPVTGYLTVVLFQGGLVYLLVMHGCSDNKGLEISYIAIIAACLLIGGFYPLTQIYQHKQDKDDGVITISSKLGYKGTFMFTAIIYFLAMGSLGIYLTSVLELQSFIIIQIFFIPILVNFILWYKKVIKNTAAANYKNTMQMSLLASICSNAAFITLFIIEKN